MVLVSLALIFTQGLGFKLRTSQKKLGFTLHTRHKEGPPCLESIALIFLVINQFYLQINQNKQKCVFVFNNVQSNLILLLRHVVKVVDMEFLVNFHVKSHTILPPTTRRRKKLARRAVGFSDKDGETIGESASFGGFIVIRLRVCIRTRL